MKLAYSKAVTQALAEAMQEDDSVFCLGEDVGYGGAYGATQGLRDRFGADRVRDTPISESAIVGFSVGAAMSGMRPVAEIMHMDFIAIAMDQVVNQAAKMRYMFGGKAKVPITIRCGVGGYLNAAAQHSQSLESWFTHIPGLKVMSAATPADIRQVLRDAILDDNPTLVLEPFAVYETTGEVPDAYTPRPIGYSDVKRRGEDLTIVTWGHTVPEVLEAAKELETASIECEVIDLLSLSPWDRKTVLDSVWRTNRAMVVHQAHRTSGFGAEIAATITEQAFDELDGPVVRVCGLDTPIPFAPEMERYVLPTASRIVSEVKKLF
ncbi:alpha-ketoacid dehydrogenase subunit beta [Mameliella alba]|uniref:alpha-ketoacid dehydrogenase subunit beta n=1 Tax=Mameliella alba TaxID=561184 RepID=UPI001C95310B|nr:alpha-ketoacid dehydrogenase subunit beta [Mameliella alba]MBY6120396.1 alpha-ketoacid dehydrogenase subunit beta [Mameliella alba]